MYASFHALFIFFTIVNFIYFLYIAIHVVGWISLPVSLLSNFTPKTKITVVISARNEEGTIQKCLNAISAQTYPATLIEIIVVDDHSSDKTKEVAEKTLSQINIVSKCISKLESIHGKKSAITEAIKNSSGELIVVTDADCWSNNKWLSTIEAEYQKSGAYMLYGPVQIICGNSFLERFQSLELDGFSLLSGAGLKIGVPLLCSGANIAYTRKLFNDVEGFKGIDNNPTGDDVLLMFKVHKKYPNKISFVKSRDALVSTSAHSSLNGFLLQRIRWGSKGLYSKNFANSFVSILVFSSNLFSVIAILVMLVWIKLYPILMLALGIKVVADLLLLFCATHFFNREKRLWIFPVAELVTMLYISCVGMASNFLSYSWKGRQYKRPV